MIKNQSGLERSFNSIEDCFLTHSSYANASEQSSLDSDLEEAFLQFFRHCKMDSASDVLFKLL